eukprot:91424-Prorocentrum_minimum.AAC.3
MGHRARTLVHAAPFRVPPVLTRAGCKYVLLLFFFSRGTTLLSATPIITIKREPFSEAQTRRVSAAVKEVLIYVPPDLEEVQEMLAAVRRKLTSAVAEVALPPWPAAALAAAPGAAALAAR